MSKVGNAPKGSNVGNVGKKGNARQPVRRGSRPDVSRGLGNPGRLRGMAAGLVALALAAPAVLALGQGSARGRAGGGPDATNPPALERAAERRAKVELLNAMIAGRR